jgi:hypothetical protein
LKQSLHYVRVEAIALVRTVEAYQGDLAFELVGDHLFLAHELLLVSTGKFGARRK